MASRAAIIDSHLKLQVLLSLAVLLQLAPFDLAVGGVGAQLGQLRGGGAEARFVRLDLLLLTEHRATRSERGHITEPPGSTAFTIQQPPLLSFTKQMKHLIIK